MEGNSCQRDLTGCRGHHVWLFAMPWMLLGSAATSGTCLWKQVCSPMSSTHIAEVPLLIIMPQVCLAGRAIVRTPDVPVTLDPTCKACQSIQLTRECAAGAGALLWAGSALASHSSLCCCPGRLPITASVPLGPFVLTTFHCLCPLLPPCSPVRYL